MRWLSRATTIAALAVLAGVATLVLWPRIRPTTVEGSFRTHAHFRDADGLPVGSRVVIAGVIVGEIEGLAIEGNQARVDMRLQDDVALWDDAYATRKASSVLSDNYVELSPGGPDSEDPASIARPHRRLRSGEPIPRVIEAATTDRVLRGLERAVPRLETSLQVAQGMVVEAREWTDGALMQRMSDLDRRLDRRGLEHRLADIDDATARFERATERATGELAAALPTVDRGLDSLLATTADAQARIRAAGVDVRTGLADVRTSLDEVDGYVARADELVRSVAGEDSGALGTLIHDDELGTQIADLTAAGAEASANLDRLKTVIGFRTELNLLAGAPRFYVSAQIAARGDQFYLVELMKGFDGDEPEIQLVDRPGVGFVRVARIRQGIRYTAQWGKRIGPLAVRFGFRDSAIGAGADASLLRGRLRLSADIWQPNLTPMPRVKLAAALEVFRSVYVLGGIDDAFTGGAELQIAPWTTEADVPTELAEVRYGRDYFLGFNLSFTDADINRLLRIYGGLVATLVK